MTQKPIKATLDSSDDSVKTQKPILIQLDDIPTPEVGDAGKVLGVDDEGKYALTEGGGGGVNYIDFATIAPILTADVQTALLSATSSQSGDEFTITAITATGSSDEKVAEITAIIGAIDENKPNYAVVEGTLDLSPYGTFPYKNISPIAYCKTTVSGNPYYTLTYDFMADLAISKALAKIEISCSISGGSSYFYGRVYLYTQTIS